MLNEVQRHFATKSRRVHPCPDGRAVISYQQPVTGLAQSPDDVGRGTDKGEGAEYGRTKRTVILMLLTLHTTTPDNTPVIPPPLQKQCRVPAPAPSEWNRAPSVAQKPTWTPELLFALTKARQHMAML